VEGRDKEERSYRGGGRRRKGDTEPGRMMGEGEGEDKRRGKG